MDVDELGDIKVGRVGGASGLGCESAALELLALAASQSKAGAQEVGAHEEAPGAARVRTGGEGGGEGPGEGGARDLWPGVDVDRGSVILRQPGQAGQAWKPVDAEALGGLGGRAGRCLSGEAAGLGGQVVARGDGGQLHGSPSIGAKRGAPTPMRSTTPSLGSGRCERHG